MKPTRAAATNEGQLAGKVAIVTGGARGVGAATARLFVHQGARVVIMDVLEERGLAVAADLGPNAMFCGASVSSAADWKRTLDVAHAFGPVSILVNNAALLSIAKLEDSKESDYERLFRVNQLGPVLGIKAVMPDMMEARWGSIINMGSVDALLAHDIGLTAYASTKWAMRGITKAAALELGRYGIRVNIVHSDGGSTEMTQPFLGEQDAAAVMEAQLRRILEPPRGRPRNDRIRDITYMILFLASDESAGCTAGDFPVDGAYSAGRRIT